MKRHLATLTAVCLALSLSACHRHRSLTQQELKAVTDLTANLTPRCVGRYLIDVPADAHIFQTIDVERVRVSAQPMPLDAYKRAMQARSEELGAAKTHFGYRFLYADHAVDGIPDSRYFVSLGEIGAMTDAERLIEAYRWDRGYQIKMQIEASSAKDAVYFKDRPAVRDDPDMTNVAERLRLVISLLSRAKGRADDEIPTEPGMCFQGGFLAGKARDRENTKTKFVLDSHHDVNINIDTDSDIRTTDTLLQRGAQIREGLSRNKGRTVRNGTVELPDGLLVQEWLMAGITTADVPGFHFALEANSLVGSPQSPLIILVLDVGAPNRMIKAYDISSASLTEGESVALWDKVSHTLRPRPNGF